MFFLRGSNGLAVKLTTHFQSRWMMNGAIAIISVYAFMACTGTNFLCTHYPLPMTANNLDSE